MTSDQQSARLAAIAGTSDPAREALFRFGLTTGQPFSRDDAADAAGLPRSTAAFHLDRLVELGLLGVEFHRRGEKTGPGAGRPAKFYRVLVDEVSASVPERHYDLAGEVLSAAVELSDETGMHVKEAMATVAVDRGRSIGATAASLHDALEKGGYVPQPDGNDVALTNCPFHHLAKAHTATICGLNHALLRGIVEGAGEEPNRAAFVPDAPRCCVRIVPAEG